MKPFYEQPTSGSPYHAPTTRCSISTWRPIAIPAMPTWSMLAPRRLTALNRNDEAPAAYRRYLVLQRRNHDRAGQGHNYAFRNAHLPRQPASPKRAPRSRAERVSSPALAMSLASLPPSTNSTIGRFRYRSDASTEPTNRGQYVRYVMLCGTHSRWL